MSALQLSLYWKRRVWIYARYKKTSPNLARRVERIIPYATALASRNCRSASSGSYQLAVAGKGHSRSRTSLVFVFRTRDGRIAARVAARLVSAELLVFGFANLDTLVCRCEIAPSPPSRLTLFRLDLVCHPHFTRFPEGGINWISKIFL